MCVARRRWPGRSCDLHPTSARKFTSMLGYDNRGGTPLLHHPCTSGGIPIGTRQHRPFSSLLCRYPHQSSTRPHTRLHTRPTHSPSKEFRLHSLNHLQESSDSKLLIPFRELRLDSRLRAFGPRALRPSRLTPSRVLWFDTTYRALPHPGFVPYPIPDLWFYITYLFRYNTTQHMFLPCAGFNSPDLFFILYLFSPLSPCNLPVSCCLATSVVRSRSTG